jgi:cysteine desulfurase
MSRSYFDHNATTPVAPEVIETVVEALRHTSGNASSIHADGQAAKHSLETARRQIAGALNANATEIVFTSGGTEADNLAVLGLVRQIRQARKHVITTSIEHPAVLESCRQLEHEGVDVTYLPVSRSGAISASDVRSSIRPETALVSVMHANNETGAVQPIREVADVIAEANQAEANLAQRSIFFHSDGVQAFGKLPIDVGGLGVDLYSVSAHKCYAPKGTGALYVRKGVPLSAIQLGGRHERGRRAGTENVAGAAAFGRAVQLIDIDAEAARLTELRDTFEQRLLDSLSDVEINGDPAARLPNTSNLYFGGVDGEALVIALDMRGFSVSTGAACSSGSIEASHVLLAMGKSPEAARRCIRFSFGRYNTEQEVEILTTAVIQAVGNLRSAKRRSGPALEGEYARI